MLSTFLKTKQNENAQKKEAIRDSCFGKTTGCQSAWRRLVDNSRIHPHGTQNHTGHLGNQNSPFSSLLYFVDNSPGFGLRFHTFPAGMASSKNSLASPWHLVENIFTVLPASVCQREEDMKIIYLSQKIQNFSFVLCFVI